MIVFVLTRSDVTGRDGLLLSAHATLEGAKTEGTEWAKRQAESGVLEQYFEGLEWLDGGVLAARIRKETWDMLGAFAEHLGRTAPVPPPFENPVPTPYWSAQLDGRWLYCIDQRELVE